MNKIIFISITILSVLISSCVSTISYNGNKNIEQEIYIQEPGNTIPEGSSILVVGAYANRETGYFVKYLEEKLGKKNYFNIISSDKISDNFQSYPCNVISQDIENERDSEIITSGFERNDNKKIEEIGNALNANYVFMTYIEIFKKYEYQKQVFWGVNNMLKHSYKIKGTLWDVAENKAIGQSYYLISDKIKIKYGFFEHNYYSKNEDLIEIITEKAAIDISKRIIRENK